MGLTSFMVGVGAIVVVLGPKDLPIVARKLGFAVGKSVAFLRSARRVVHEASKDPEMARMVADVQKGVEDMQRIRAEIQSLSSRTAIPYLLANETENLKKESTNVSQQQQQQQQTAVATPVSSSDLLPLPVMPNVSKKIFSPSHAEKIQVPGGADLIIESLQQSEIARSWKKKD